MRFTKMNGAGNDFILLDAIAEPFDESAAPALARALCDRRRSVGADGLMLVTRAEGDADYRMRFYNSDGSLGEMCGNGARCICRYGYARGYAGPVQRVETTAGLVTGWRITEEQYRIRLNTPSVVELEKQLDADGRTYRCSYIELGSPGIPHLALEVPALAKQSEDALRRLGQTVASPLPTQTGQYLFPYQRFQNALQILFGNFLPCGDLLQGDIAVVLVLGNIDHNTQRITALR